MVKKKKIIIKPRFYIIIGLLIILLLLLLIPKSYEKKYTLNEFNIYERFNNNRYNLSISVNDKVFDYNFDSKFLGKKIVNSINTYSNDNAYCILININKHDSVPLCNKNNEYVDYSLIDDFNFDDYSTKLTEDNKTYDNINTYNLLSKSYLIWNYREFISLSNKGKETISLFNNDQYNIELCTTINNYLVIANYDSLYNFKELILINLNNLKKEVWNLNYEISFESYILGTLDNDIYIVDKKNKLEYKLDIKRKEMKIVGTEERNGTILENGKFENISMYKLVNNNMTFTYDYDEYYLIDNNKLYLKTLNNKVLVSNNVDKIIYSNNNYVYYLVGDTLYYYDINYKNVKVMSSFEWNFNNNNIIFINTNKK